MHLYFYQLSFSELTFLRFNSLGSLTCTILRYLPISGKSNSCLSLHEPKMLESFFIPHLHHPNAQCSNNPVGFQVSPLLTTCPYTTLDPMFYFFPTLFSPPPKWPLTLLFLRVLFMQQNDLSREINSYTAKKNNSQEFSF